MNIEFVENNEFWEVQVIENGQVYSNRIFRNDNQRILFQRSVQLLESQLPGYRWYINPAVNREWAYGPAGINITCNDQRVIWCYPFSTNIVSFWLPFNSLDILQQSDNFEPGIKQLIDRHIIGKFFDYNVIYRTMAGNGNWLFISIDNANRIEELVTFLTTNNFAE